MTRCVRFSPGGAPVSEAAELMSELDVGTLPVSGADNNFDPFQSNHRSPSS